MLLAVMSSEYSFFNNMALIKFNSSVSFSLEQILKARCANAFIKLILCLRGQNNRHRVYKPVNVDLR